MSDTPERPWELRPRQLIILPDVGLEEFTEIWESVKGTHESSPFWIGDAQIFSERFGEEAAQAFTGNGYESVRQCRWVCSRIEPGRRKDSLSFSAHRAVAKLDPAEQDELLTLAVSNAWHTEEIKAEIKRRQEERYRGNNGGPPAEESPPEFDAAETPAGDAAAQEADPGPAVAPEFEPTDKTPRRGDNGAPDPVVQELRALIDQVKALTEDLSLGKADTFVVGDLHDDVARALGVPRKQFVVSDRAARSLVPAAWRIRIEGGEEVGGRRAWTVELRKGEQIAVGDGPHLPAAVTEAALAARLSDMGRDERRQS